MTFANDVMLTAGTTGADGVAALYTEDFAGEGGPMADNYYVYDGPTVNPGPTSMWFSYSYTGSNTFFGSSAGGGMIFGYRITPEMLQELGLGNCAITTVEAAAREGSYYDLMLLKGGDTPDVNNMVYYQSFEDYTPLYFFDLNLDEPQFLGDDENIWVMFYSDSPYAAYCGKQPVDVNNGKLWYTTNLTNWYSNTTYTPVIYTRFLELPTGREVTVNLADMTIRESKPAAGQIAEAEGLAMGTPKAQLKQNNNRDVVGNNIEDLYVPAGTYYLAVASTDAEFPVSIETAEVPAPEQAIVYAPMDGETNVEYPYIAEWMLGDYTEEMQVLFDTQYPPQAELIGWTDELVAGVLLPELMPNQSYFLQVNERNAAGTTMGEIIAITTPIDAVEGFAVENDMLYPGEAAVFTWEANRSLMGYNLYKDGVKVNETPITENTYAYEGLEYNMPLGSEFTLTAVYAAGESAPTEPITVYMTGTGVVMGHVYDAPDGYDPADPDQSHPVAGLPVTMIVLDQYMQSQEYEFVTDEEGMYTGEVLAGLCVIGISQDNAVNYGYAVATIEGIYVNVAYEDVIDGLDIYTHEYYYPLSMITATEEENDVLVEWAWTPAEVIVDFETGDFSQAEFTLPATYPWAITTTNPHAGTYGMKSTCEGVASGTSSIEATVEVPYDAKMGFWVKVSSETNYDKFHFYIDGVEQGSALSGALDYQYKEYTVAEGTHTYKWEYAKDSSVNSNDDCVYVDDITLFRQDVPVPPTPGATTYTFDNSTMEGWTSLDANNDGYGWVLGSEAGGIYLIAGASLAGSGHNESADMVVSGSFTNYTQTAITPDNYLVAPAQMSVQDGASISFWACGQDSGYPAEHFGVAVSTGAATASEFTMVQEWTLTAKNAPAAEEHGEMRGSRAQGTWYNYSADLSSYAGQDIWVAIRHFNCNDEFLLDVDDITLYDGTDRGFNRGDRSFASYNLYRRNNLDTVNAAYEPTLIASGLASDVMSYVDNDWATLPYGEYQWGIQATYDGYAPVPERSRETATFGFEGGLEGWTGIVVNTDGGEWIHSDDNLGGYDYSEHAHTGTGFAMCYSFVDYVGSFDTDAYLVSPQKYSVDANSSISFWADNANDSYPENFSVCVSTAATPTAASFTQVWSGGAKGTGNGGATVRRAENRYDNWRSHEISLAAYAGQEIWIAFHDVNYDMYEIWIDDVTINYAGGAPVPPTPGPTGDGLSEILWSNVVDKDMIATVTFNVALNNGQSPEGAVIELEALANEYEFTVGETGTITEEIRKGEYLVEIELEGYDEYIDILEVTEDAMEVTYVLDEIIAPVADFYVSPTGWAMWEGAGVTPTPPTPPTPGEGEWYYYDNGINEDAIGTGGGNFWWAVMFPAGSYEGNAVTKVATYDYRAMTGNVTIYNDGTTAPATAVGTADVTLTGSEEFVEVEFAEPVTIDPSKNLWVVYYNGSGTDYPAAVCANTGDANGRWVSLDGTSWEDMASYSLDYTFMIRAYVATSNRGEVVEITAPQGNGSNGTFANAGVAMRGDRAPMSYKVFLEDVHVGDTKYPFFQVPVEGLVEGETYTVGVAPLYATGMGETMYATFVYSACENYDGATSYSAAVDGQDVTLTWTLPGTPGPGPGPQPGPEETFDFDDSTLQGWTTIDGGSPSGYGWHLGSTTLGTGNGHNASADLVISQSYDNNYGVIYPNNFLISPAKAQYAQISFWACGQDASYAAEHFGVAVSTGSATASDFVMVNEWTIGQKGERYEGPRGARAQSTWTEYTADLSAYAGQEIWVAIRHFNCSDMFYLDVDDITLTSAAKRNRSVLYEAHFVTDPGAMANGADASWIKGSQSTWGPNINNGAGYKLADDFTLDAATTITEIEVYGYQTGSTTTSTFTGLYAQIYDGAPNAGGQVVWGDETSNIMTSTSFTNCYRGSDGETTATTRPLMAITAENLNIELEAGTYYLVWSLAGSASSGPWAGIEALPGVGNTGDGIQYSASNGWVALTDSGAGTPYGGAFKLVGEGGGPVPPTPGDILGVMIWRDGEPLTMAPIAGTTFVDNDVEAGEHDYAIRVVYSDYAMACEQIETVTVGGAPSCDPVINPNGYYMNYQGQEGLVVDWTDPEGVTAIGLYEIDGGTPVFIGNAAPGQHPIFLGFEGQVPACTITIGFVAVYADCESEMVTCDIYYDAVDEQEVVNAIYPNPTSGDLHVNATAMTHVTVYNAMGQMVYDQEVSGDELILNMGQYEAGVYMVKVTTETGSSVKRINVVR
ncbi:MAG: choice-of-anchor J domain-containing protein [Bacteroidales bacterium]|nr:choice-of-anchor J domain-containing protein [Bacteroidales bacterium]